MLDFIERGKGDGDYCRNIKDRTVASLIADHHWATALIPSQVAN